MSEPWTLGWEFVLALVTLLLASFTGWLAWTTRMLARTTSEEVQGQTRPVLVPLRATFEAAAEDQDYFHQTLRLRNIGAGPALNVKVTIGRGDSRDGYSDTLPAMAVGDESDVRVGVRIKQEDEGSNTFHMRTSPVGIAYFDLAGRRYTTSTYLGGGPTGFSEVRVSAGSPPPEAPITGTVLIDTPLSAARRNHQRIRGLPRAWRYHVLQEPDALPRPLWPRLREAWRWMYPKFRRTRMQRLVWAHRAYHATLDKPVRRWVRGPLRRPYLIARGVRWGYRVYRNLRF